MSFIHSESYISIQLLTKGNPRPPFVEIVVHTSNTHVNLDVFDDETIMTLSAT